MPPKTINKDTVAQDIQSQTQLRGMSDEDLKAAIQQQRQDQLKQTVGSAAGQVGDIFLQGQPFHTIDPTTGRPIQLPASGISGAKQPSQLDELIQLQKFNLLEKQAEQKQRQAEQKEERESFKFEQERKTATRKEAEDRRKRGLAGEGEPIAEPIAEPTPTTLPAQQPTGEAPQGIPQAIPTAAGTREEVVTGFTEEGIPTTTVQERPEVKIRREQATKLASGKRISFTNLEKVAGSISDLDKVFAAGHKAKELGSLEAELRFKAAQFLGGRLQDEFPNASAFPGKKAEVLFNMIPMLTQQGEKPGSVRIMRSVLKLLGKTLPDNKTGLKAGRKQMAESVRSFFRFARAAELGGIEFDRQFSKTNFETLATESIDEDGNVTITFISPELRSWVAKVRRAAGRVRLGPEEEEALKLFIDNTLKSSGDLISERDVEGQGKIAVREINVIDEELADIERQLRGQ